MKKIKNMFLIGLTLLTLSCLPVSAATMAHFTTRMLTGTYLCVSNSATIMPTNTGYWYYSYAAGTNVQAGLTNTLGVFNWPQGLVQAPIVPDINADVNPNLAIQVVCNYGTNLFLQGVQSPVMLNTVWTNPGPAFTNGVVNYTNTLTITFTRVGGGDFNVPDNQNMSTNTYVCVVGITNLVPTVQTFTLPTVFLQGTYAISPSIVAGASTGSAQGIVVNGINLIGWKP